MCNTPTPHPSTANINLRSQMLSVGLFCAFGFKGSEHTWWLVRVAQAGMGHSCLLSFCSLFAPFEEWGPPPSPLEAPVVICAGRGATCLSSAIRGLCKTQLSSPGSPLIRSSLCSRLCWLQRERRHGGCPEDGTRTGVIAVTRFGFQMFLCSTCLLVPPSHASAWPPSCRPVATHFLFSLAFA